MKLEDDKLSRKEILKGLIKFFETFGNQSGHGLTMIINGKYGTGKTTLLSFLMEQNNQDNLFNILYYDAWEYNYFENPLIPLMFTIGELKSAGEKIKKMAKNVIKAVPEIFFKSLANKHLIDLSPLTDNEDIFKGFKIFNDSINECKNALKEFCENKKTILLIDELDRCLPEYQIKVLECLYHVFDIPNLIIVIALDKNQLENSIKKQFGEYVDITGYLSKFIQYEIDLPCNYHEYAKTLMKFKCQYDDDIKSIISNMFEALNLSIRDVNILTQQLNLICKEVTNPDGKAQEYLYFYPIIVIFLILLKFKNKSIYDKYFSKELPINYKDEVIAFKDSNFYKFISKISGTAFENVIGVLLEDPLGQASMLQVINLFCNVNSVNVNDLTKFIKRTSPEDVKQLILEARRYNNIFPYNVNSLIKKINLLQ